MSIFQAAKQHIAWQKQEFQNSSKEINAANAATLKSASTILAAVCTGAWLVSILLPSFYKMQMPYGIWWGSMFLFWLISIRAVRRHTDTRGYLYFMFTSMFLFTIYLSVVASPMYRASIFLGLLPAVPLLILDKSWRINGYLCGMTLLHTLLSFFIKSRMSAAEDALNSAILLTLGIFVGGAVRKTNLHNFELQRQAQSLSEMDFLTGLYNRRKMYELLQESAAGGRTAKGVLLLDIDHFKDYNDHYGHQAGDDCLQQIGTFLRAFSSKHNMEMFRFGGEEFIGFSFAGGSTELTMIAEELRCGIYDLAIPHVMQSAGRVSVSVGLCAGEGTVNKMISSADQALYSAKSNGRNRCDVGKL